MMDMLCVLASVVGVFTVTAYAIGRKRLRRLGAARRRHQQVKNRACVVCKWFVDDAHCCYGIEARMNPVEGDLYRLDEDNLPLARGRREGTPLFVSFRGWPASWYQERACRTTFGNPVPVMGDCTREGKFFEEVER